MRGGVGAGATGDRGGGKQAPVYFCAPPGPPAWWLWGSHPFASFASASPPFLARRTRWASRAATGAANTVVIATNGLAAKAAAIAADPVAAARGRPARGRHAGSSAGRHAGRPASGRPGGPPASGGPGPEGPCECAPRPPLHVRALG
jgi:hypothetical protein